jgi:endonuclease/exonuclease/phosphatase (EEP) superfamily protein YafD
MQMSRVQTALRLLAAASVLGFSLMTFVSGFGEFHWVADLVTHFRVQAAIAGVLVAVSCAMLRMYVGFFVTCASIAFHVYPVLPFLLPTEPLPTARTPQLRVMQINVHTGNRNHRAVRRAIADANPDIIGLLEVNERWLSALAPLHVRYPYRIEDPREDNFGIALLSRFPIENLQLRSLERGGVQIVTGDFSLGSVPVTVVIAHLVPPVGSSYSAYRNRQFLRLSESLQQFDNREIILLGDLNTSPWSPFYRELERSTGLSNSARGFGLQPTWPAALLPLLRIPIDHCLLSSRLRATAFNVGPQVGSDHLPILVEIASLQSAREGFSGKPR